GICVADDGSNWHAQHDVVGALPVLVGAAAVFAAMGAVDARVTVVDQRVDVAIGDGPDAAAGTAVAPIGPAARDVFFASKRCRAVAAAAGNDVDDRLVEKFHGDFRV